MHCCQGSKNNFFSLQGYTYALASKYKMKTFERENLFIKGGIFVYRTVVFFKFMKLKLTHDKCDCCDVLIKPSLLANINKASFVRYKRHLNRLCAFLRYLNAVNVQCCMYVCNNLFENVY